MGNDSAGTEDDGSVIHRMAIFGVEWLLGALNGKGPRGGQVNKRAAASFAALCPHMPWTPPPGGVEDEQM